MSEEVLFSKNDIFQVIEGQKAAVKQRVQEIPANKLLNASERDLVQALVEEFLLDVPVIEDEGIHIADSREREVDVSRDPMRMIIDRSQPFYRIRLAMAEQPDWQPISRLPLIGSMIDGMLQDAEEHYQTLLQASPKPHVLDDYTVGRVFEVFGSQKDDLWLFEEQLARWKMDKLSVGQRHEVDRLTEQVGRCRTVIDSILSLAQQLKEGTIEKVLAKSDLELGLEFLLNKEKPHH